MHSKGHKNFNCDLMSSTTPACFSTFFQSTYGSYSIPNFCAFVIIIIIIIIIISFLVSNSITLLTTVCPLQ